MSNLASILIVDDEKNIREGLKKALIPLGYKVLLAADGEEGLKTYLTNEIDLAIFDIQMPKLSGTELLSKIKEIQKIEIIPILFITGHGNIETAVECMQLGAYDFLTKPLNLQKLEILIERALKLNQISLANQKLTEKIQSFEIEKNILGNSKPIQKLRERIIKIAPTKGNVYILGESGTGKELVCNAIHQIYGKEKPLIKVNCAALTSTLMESELFGHEKGAFTGADSQKKGRFELAAGGTLFLDEVSEIPKDIQVKLLRVLQERQIERVGGATSIKVDFRLICASNKDLQAEVKKGNFREDLFYRINVLDIYVPPLRDRAHDIPFLSQYFFQKFLEESNCEHIEITPQVFSTLREYNWPGNIRELINVIEKTVILNEETKITTQQLPQEIRSRKATENNIIEIPIEFSLEEMEKKIIQQVIQYCQGNKTEAANMLKIGRKTLHRKIENPKKTNEE